MSKRYEVVRELELTAIEDVLQKQDPRGERSYAPRMMTSLTLYAYCVGVLSSRKIERATFEDVALRVLAGGEHPHFTTVNSFRLEHRKALAGLFVHAYISLRKKDAERHDLPPTTEVERMRIMMQVKLGTAEGQRIYGRRKVIVEPVFGQITSAKGFRRFSLRGPLEASSEWGIVGTCHNLLKLLRAPRLELKPA